MFPFQISVRCKYFLNIFFCSVNFLFFTILYLPSFQNFIISFTISITETSVFGPKFQLLENSFNLPYCFFARIKYPFNGSRTNCHCLVKLGFLTVRVLFAVNDFIASGIKRLCAQSPPPTMFAVRTLEIPHCFFIFLKISL